MPGAKRPRRKRQPVKKRRRVAQPAEGPYGHTTGRPPYTRRPGEAHPARWLGGLLVRCTQFAAPASAAPTKPRCQLSRV
eukprot:scaffold15352_cov107-Isochrysis_galbana.AAC.1